MEIRFPKLLLVLTLTACWHAGSHAQAQPTVSDALRLAPVQKDVDFDNPTAADAAKCTIKAEKINGMTGWVVRDPSGQILRNFVDTNADSVVDQWSYYKSGTEVYRDVDSNFNKKADQYRWLNLGGTRWGIDKDEDSQIDRWKTISAEEVSSEAVAAIVNEDTRRFARLLASSEDLESLDLDSAREKELAGRLNAAAGKFAGLVREKKLLGPESRFAYFGGGRPGMVPASGDGKGDLVVYENVIAMVDVAGKNDQVVIGTLVRVGDTWRLLDVPAALSGAQGNTFFGGNDNREIANAAGADGATEEIRELTAELEKIDQAIGTAASPEEISRLNTRRAETIEKLAEISTSPDDKAQWIRQLADTLLAAVQMGTFPEGVDRLKKLGESLEKNTDSDLVSYVQFRVMTAEFYLAQQSGENIPSIQEKWLKDLEAFVTANPKSPDAADAMMQLAMAEEFAGNDNKALRWYSEIVTNFPNAPSAAMAKGAQTRLSSVGKPITVAGKKFNGPGVANLSNYKDKVVLVHYWSSEYDVCKAEIPQLIDMQAKYAKSGFAILSVCLDRDSKSLQQYLAGKKLPWELIYEPGGFNSRLAVEMGINTAPTMLLLDKKGRVINRSIHTAELDSELQKLLVGQQRQANRP